MTAILYAYWPVAVLLMATGQGLLLPAIRRTPPGAEARRQAFALHGLLTAAYFLPLALAPHTWQSCVASRVLLFDLTINLFSKKPAFYVGNTSAFDRLLRRLAPAHPERLRLGVWIISAIICIIYLVFR